MRRLLALAAATLLLAGCEAPPVYGPSPTPSVKPFFANEQEALDAVDAFMKEYVDATAQFLASNGADKSRLAALVSREQMIKEEYVLASLAENGVTFAGKYGYYRLEIQQVNQDSTVEAYVQAYVCLDLRESRYVRTDGSTYEGQYQWIPNELIMTSDGRNLTLDELREWTGRDFCEP